MASEKSREPACARRGDWVQIHSVLLTPEERSPKIPADTAEVPLEMWVHGFLQDETGEIGNEVRVETAIGRIVEGTLCDIRPGYHHSYGVSLPELQQTGRELRGLLRRHQDSAERGGGDE
ncbi:MAG: 2-amino-4-oxopentanoate thiolase subunit OrtA [Spirochaetaceae bacterium]